MAANTWHIRCDFLKMHGCHLEKSLRGCTRHWALDYILNSAMTLNVQRILSVKSTRSHMKEGRYHFKRGSDSSAMGEVTGKSSVS